MNEKDRHKKTPYPLRMPDELRAKLEKAAGESGRSMNAEIVARLQASFEQSQWSVFVSTGSLGRRKTKTLDDLSLAYSINFDLNQP